MTPSGQILAGILFGISVNLCHKERRKFWRHKFGGGGGNPQRQWVLIEVCNWKRNRNLWHPKVSEWWFPHFVWSACLSSPLAPRHSVEKKNKKTKTKVESEASDALRCLFSSKQRAALILAKKTHKSDVLCMAVHNHPQDALIYLPILHGLMVSDLIHPWPSEQQGNAQPHIDYIPSAAILRASPIICF